MDIGVFTRSRTFYIELKVEEGSYSLIGDTSVLEELNKGRIIVIRRSGSKVSCNLTGKGEMMFPSIRLVPTTNNSKLRYKIPKWKERIYDDGVKITSVSGKLIIVNQVDMDDYLSGVLLSEGGRGKPLEYYKVQALMSRTYALKNRDRHKKEGYQLCDNVHCQAYHKTSNDEKIRKATRATSGLIIVTKTSNEPISTYFSANCGGQTCEASYVWNTDVDYITSFIDTFCIHTKQAKWIKKIPKYQWKSFLEKHYGVKEEKYGNLLYNFKQESRKAFYIHPSLGVPLRDLRKKFRLKSTFFSTRSEGDYIVLEGRGFGHGVGLCQEGAMEMARQGFNFKQIALFYFSNVRIINYYKAHFFEQQEEGW